MDEFILDRLMKLLADSCFEVFFFVKYEAMHRLNCILCA